MRSLKKHLVSLTTLFLIIFSIGTVYDRCAGEWLPNASSHSATALSNDAATAPRGASDADAVDCHCLCHFSFQPANNAGIEESVLYRPLVSTLKEFVKAPPIDAILRPPIFLL